ncbi:hypothetical protein R3W88_024768 [Solanum pinnatisectum]|uniref:DUF7081 domain-containing protein n=1 Tax=Solanum pinnatisectum TaxID=50273 RepID=A0AAV9M4G4_9SOLN|nr:hypothetical protein R3W88_024768 [Solanum pinnatisectum]
MSANEEVGESCAHVVYNGSASRINETIGLLLYPIFEYDSGKGLPYAHVDWPNTGYKWGWRAGNRVTSLGTFRDRYLYLPKHFKAPKDIHFDSNMKERTTSSGSELQSLLSDSSIYKMSLVSAETVIVSFAAKLSVQTMMDTVTFDVKQQ